MIAHAERVRASLKAQLGAGWPTDGQGLERTMPDWAQGFINWAFQLTQRDIDPVRAFMEIEPVNTAITYIIEDTASIPRRVFRGRGDRKVEIERFGRLPADGGNLADLLFAGNPNETGKQVFQSVVAHNRLVGNGYLFLQTFGLRDRRPVELYNLPGHLVRVVPGANRSIAGYDFFPGGMGAPKHLPAESVIHFRRFNPNDDPHGLGCLEAVRNEYLAEYYALQWLKEFFRKGAVIPGIWSIDENMPPPSDEDVAAWVSTLNRRHYGYNNAWNAVIIQGLKYVASGMKLSEMEINDHLRGLDARIMRAIGVTPFVAGIKEEGWNAAGAAGGDLDNYWLRTIRGICTTFDDILNERLCPLFGPDFSVESDFSGCLQIQAALLKQAETHQRLAGGEAIEDVNEARKAMRMPPRKESWTNELAKRTVPAAFGTDGDPGPGSGTGDQSAAKASAQFRPGSDRHVELAQRAFLAARKRDARSRFEARMLAFVLDRVAEQRATAKARLMTVWEHAGGEQLSALQRARLAVDVSRLVDDPSEQDRQKAKKMLELMLAGRAGEVMVDLEALAGASLDIAIDMQNERAARFLEQQVARALDVPDDTTKKLLRDALAAGIEAGEGLDEAVQRVDQVFDGRRDNALTIARTETQSAFNFANVEGYRQSGIVEAHVWRTSGLHTGGRHSENPDGRYDGLEGQERGLDEPFDVGGAKLRFPGDPEAPANETINCVCDTDAVIDQQALSALRMRRYVASHAPRERPHVNGNGHVPANRIREYFYGGRAA